MQTILALVVATLAAIHPTAPAVNVQIISTTIARTVVADCHDGGALGSCELDAVVLAVSAEEEGGLCLGRACKRGDQDRSSSTFQTMGQTPAETDLYERDLGAAARHAYAVIRIGAAQCPDEPLAPYCGSCRAPAARRMAAARLARAREAFHGVLLAALSGEGILWSLSRS